MRIVLASGCSPACHDVACFLAGLVVLRAPTTDAQFPTPPEIRHERVLDEATVAMERDQLEAIKRELEGVQDPETIALLEEIDELLDDVDIMLDAASGGIGPKNKIKYLEHGSGSCSKVGSRARWPMCSSTAPPTTSNDSLVHGEESFCLVIDTHACR